MQRVNKTSYKANQKDSIINPITSGVSQFLIWGLVEIFFLVAVVVTRLSFTTTPIYSIWGILQAIRYVVPVAFVSLS